MGKVIQRITHKSSIIFNINGDEITDLKTKTKTGRNIFAENQSAQSGNAGVAEPSSGDETSEGEIPKA